MRVIFKANGQQYDIPDDKFDPNIWEAPQQAKKEGMDQYLPIVGQILGGIGGGLIGGPVGAVAGAGAGGALGEGAHQMWSGEKADVGKMAKEGLWGVGGELAGIGIAKLAGKALGKLAPKLAEKAIGASPTEIRNAVKLVGKTPGEIGLESGLLTRNPEIIKSALKPVNEAYSSIVGKETTKIAKKELVDSILTKAAELDKSAVPAMKAKANTLLEVAINVEKTYGDTIGGKALQELKMQLGKEAGANRLLMGKNNVYKTGEDVVRSSLYDAAGEATTPVGKKAVEMTLPQIGKKEQELIILDNIKIIKHCFYIFIL